MSMIRATLSALALACATVSSAQEQKQEPEMSVDQVTEFIRKYNDDYITPMNERREKRLYGEAVRREVAGALKPEERPSFSKCRETAYALYRRGDKEKIPSLRHVLFSEARRSAYEGKDDVLGRLATIRMGGSDSSYPPVDVKSVETRAEARLLVEWCLRMDEEFAALKRYDVSQRYIAAAQETVQYVKDPVELQSRIREREKALEALAKTVLERFDNNPLLPDRVVTLEIELKGVTETPSDAGGYVPTAHVLVRKHVDGRSRAKLFMVHKGDRIGDGDLATKCEVLAITPIDAEMPDEELRAWELQYKDAAGNEKTIRSAVRR